MIWKKLTNNKGLRIAAKYQHPNLPKLKYNVHDMAYENVNKQQQKSEKSCTNISIIITEINSLIDYFFE